MAHCSNCGNESSKRICQSCGVKQDLFQNYCKNCGHPLAGRASICVNCSEKVKPESVFWTLLNIFFTLVFVIGIWVSIDTKEPFLPILFYAIGGLICLPVTRKLINNLTIGKRPLRIVLKILRVILAIVFFILGIEFFNSSPVDTTTADSSVTSEITTEEVYNQMVAYASKDDYNSALAIFNKYPNVSSYKDANSYKTYCNALLKCSIGGIGEAYELLLMVPDLLYAQDYIQTLEMEIGYLNGVYVEDNGRGAYLYMIIEDGKVITDVVGYSDYTGDYTKDIDTTHHTYIVRSKYDNGEIYYGIGHTYSNSMDINYTMTIFEGGREILVIRPEGAEYSTFNGLYDKIK